MTETPVVDDLALFRDQDPELAGASDAAAQTVIPVADVVFRKDLYPRIETSQRAVEQYAENLEVLPPIEVNQHNELIDGWHRWTAHRKVGAEQIRVTVTETTGESHFLELAIRRNASLCAPSIASE